MKISKYVQLHFIILLWGFTPVLGKLISIDAYDLVWYRLLFSALSLYIYMRYKGISLRIKKKKSAHYFSNRIDSWNSLVLFLLRHKGFKCFSNHGRIFNRYLVWKFISTSVIKEKILLD